MLTETPFFFFFFSQKGDLNGCTKVDAAPQREPSYSGVTNYLWLLGICFRKPKPALCPDFFNGFGGGG